ncbi:hypothetical protein [uncultured Leuconostoc sp.]|uniref:hypothetical protein n=1 Tax=uncultured Leuconostoc sp. TaxID=173262 RepID=UPI0025F1BAF2|nr:hypothetical protein [uncultured Leuconostoc sp.]
MINVKKNAMQATMLVFGLLLLFVIYSLTENESILVIYFAYVAFLGYHKKKLTQKARKMSQTAHLKIKTDELYNDERELGAIMSANRFACHTIVIVLAILSIISISFNRLFNGAIALSLTNIGLLLMILVVIIQVAYVARLFYELRD